ncbi:MAG: pyruvate dehydrogenase (acetyl-transferring) E1 component subunit alpha [Nitriliruptoraceae bacterium]
MSVDHQQLLPPEDPVQLLREDGTPVDDPAWPIDLTDDELQQLHRWMVITRAVDREAINLQRQGQLAVYASCLGQEAAQVGSAAAMAATDWVFPSYRELGAATVRGIDPISLMHMYRGTWLADHDPLATRFGMLTIPIATQTLHATGFAMGTKLDGESTVTIVYLGDGATSEGDTHEALTFAGVFGAPIVFFVQNNQYAISVPVSRQTAAPTIAHKGIGYGIPGRRCDGNDVLASFAVTLDAVERARRGDGPTLIEAVTYRREAHTTSDDAGRYRSDDELADAERRDPIERFSRYLRDRGLLDDARDAAVATEAADAAAEVRSAIYDAPHGDPEELFAHVYAQEVHALDEDRARLRQRIAATQERS